MRSANRLLTTIGAALSLAVVVFVGGKFAMSGTSLMGQPGEPTAKSATGTAGEPAKSAALATATFGNGCFWCTEAVFQRLKGVKSVTSGYSGGTVKNPTYRQVCTGATGHAEAIQITFDPKEISFDDLLAVFWHSHDPTTKDRQGNDVGTQYRSVIFYHSNEQKQLAEKYKKKLDESGLYRAPIVTEIVPFSEFYPGRRLSSELLQPKFGAQPYCRVMIGPKLEN